MKILDLSLETPALNLAFEEWYFQHFTEETLRVWRNPSSVIVGKHQNALAESNTRFCQNNGLPVLRRISGGGTVFHDLGNINFSFFRFSDNHKLIDYDANLHIMSSALQKLGYDVLVNERHDMFLGGHKVSGNAQHISRGRALHHGTVLYDANMELLRSAIKRESGSFKDKAVKSVRSPVANLRSSLDSGPSHAFLSQLISAIDLEPLAFDQVGHDKLEPLVVEKYSQDDWNYGYGPGYTFSNENEQLRLEMCVARGGIIEAIEVFDLFSNTSINVHSLMGLKHQFKPLEIAVNYMNLNEGQQRALMGLLF